VTPAESEVRFWREDIFLEREDRGEMKRKKPLQSITCNGFRK